jgi:ribonuclease-3
MNHAFSNPALLEEALTHTSWAYENGGSHNERLEFLGDAVLQIFASELLFHQFPADREGILSQYRARLVNTGHLAKLARRLGLDKTIRLGKSGPGSGVSTTDRVLAGVFEAVLGAIYMDAGHEAAQNWVTKVLAPDLEALPQVGDPRKVLHEWCQKNRGAPPTYEMRDKTGPDHAVTFTMAVICKGVELAQGTGRSKGTAGIAAAEAAVLELGLA